MAKAHAGAASTPRPRSSSGAKAAAAATPATTPANRSSVCSSSSAPPARNLAKEAGKLLTYDDDDDASASHASATTQPELALSEGLVVADLAEAVLDLPDPEDTASSSSAVVSDPPHDATPAPARSALTQIAVAPSADATAAEGTTVLTEMELVLAELRAASGLSAGSKRLLAALAEAAADELDALRTRRAAFWRKLRVGVLAGTVFSVAAIDLVLAAALFGSTRGSGRHALPPT